MSTVSLSFKRRHVLGAILSLFVGFASADAHADAAHPYKFGVYEGSGCTGVANIKSFSAWSGHAPARVLDFVQDNTWAGMLSEADWMLGCWKGTPYDLIVSVPMLPTDNSSALAQGAAGNNDQYFSQLAQKLVAAGKGNTVIRLGWEFNGNWYPWAAAKDPASFIAYWRRIVSVMRAVHGSRFEFDWCPGSGWDPKPADTYYPGDAYVDIVGLDVYGQWWNNAEQTSAATRWTDLLNAVYGLNWQKTFAAAHQKQISFPEWGTGTRPDGHGGGDDPLFITNFLQWESAQSNLNYLDYWDYVAPDYNAKLSDNHQPYSGYAFLQYFNWNSADIAKAKAILTAAQSLVTQVAAVKH